MKSKKSNKVELKRVAFFGDAAVVESDPVYKTAYETARLLAKKGYVVVNGGGPGVMVAATEGAESVDGDTVAVTFYPEHASGFEGRYLANEADREVKTDNYIDRMFTLMEESDVFLLFKGGTGTISELGTAWVLAKLYYGHHKPFILVGAFWREIIGAIHKNMLIDAKEMDVFRIVDGIDGVIPVIKEFERQLSKIDHSHCQNCAEAAFMS